MTFSPNFFFRDISIVPHPMLAMTTRQRHQPPSQSYGNDLKRIDDQIYDSLEARIMIPQCSTNSWCAADLSNSIETAIAIAIFWHYCCWYCYCQGDFPTIAIDIAKGVFQLLLLLLVLLRQSQNYCS